MDTTPTPLPAIKPSTSTPAPSSSESDLTKQQPPDMINTHAAGIPPPPFSDSIDGLRSLSAALSTFLLRYDELHDHLNFIKTSIDAKLPDHLFNIANPSQSTLIHSPETYSDHPITPVPEQNPSGTATNCERSPENSRKPENPDFSKKPEKIDLSENREKPDVSETDTLKKPEETDVSMKPEETDVSMKPEATDMANKPEESDISKKPKATDMVKKPKATDMVKKPKATDMVKKPEESDISKKPKTTDMAKKPEESDISKKPKAADMSKKPEESDISKKPKAADMSKKPEESDISKKPKATDMAKKPEKSDISKKPKATDMSKKPEESDISKKPKATDMAKQNEETDISKKPALSELEQLCEKMCGRGIKKYVAAYISNKNHLLQEIPKALKLAKDPAKLVLDSIGRFFVQGSRAFVKGATQTVVRLASVVILECFVMMSSDGVEIGKEEEEYAAKAAVDWRKRMINEYGLARADEADARGLLLLISGFGIPDVFKNEDIRDLIRASKAKGISTALRRSIILIPKIPEVIDWMMKNNLEIEAVDIAYTFGLEDKCPPQTILTTFLRNKIKDEDPIKKQLSYLNSVKRCLEAHKVDPSKLLPNFKLDEKIQQLQKQKSELDSKAAEEKSTQKRKSKEPETSRKPKHQESKRTRLSSPIEEIPVHHYNGYGSLANDYISAYSSSSLLHRSGLPETIASPVAIDGAGGLAGGSYGSSVYRGTSADHGEPYGWDQDSDLIEKYLGRTYSRPGQAYDSQPLTTGLIGLYGGPSGSLIDSFPGLPNSGPSVGGSGRSGPGSDLYGFADTVVESESYRGSRASGSGTVRSSYLY